MSPREAGLASIRSLVEGSSRELVMLPLLTGSMAPAILPGDILCISPIGSRMVHTGDIAVFLKDGRLTAHRIIFAFRLCGQGLMLEMGDANRSATLLNPQSVLGTVVALHRGSAHISLAGAAARLQGRRLAYTRLWRLLAGWVPSGRLRKVLGV